MADLAATHGAFDEVGVTVWGVSTDPPRVSALLKDDQFLPFDLLSDVDRQVTRSYGILNPEERGGIPIPAVFAVAQNRQVIFAAVDRMARQTHPHVVLDAVRSGGAGPEAPVGRRWLRPRLRDLIAILGRGWRPRG